MRSVASLLAVLGLCALLASGCGSENRALIPQHDADQLNALIDEAAQASAAGKCDTAASRVRSAQSELSGLPAGTDKKLRRNLREWLDHLEKTIANECKAPKPEESATPDATETATPAPTETASPEPTETASPEPTETASPEPSTTVEPGTGGQGLPEQPSGTGGVLPENG
jgi:septal ring-binding cell division protein DamX